MWGYTKGYGWFEEADRGGWLNKNDDEDVLR